MYIVYILVPGVGTIIYKIYSVEGNNISLRKSFLTEPLKRCGFLEYVDAGCLQTINMQKLFKIMESLTTLTQRRRYQVKYHKLDL